MVLRLAANTWVLVADGGKAHVFVNEGDALSPRLREVRALGHDNPAAHEQGDDKPGRYHDGRSPHRSAVEMTDPHDEAEKTGAVAGIERLEGPGIAAPIGSHECFVRNLRHSWALSPRIGNEPWKWSR